MSWLAGFRAAQRAPRSLCNMRGWWRIRTDTATVQHGVVIWTSHTHSHAYTGLTWARRHIKPQECFGEVAPVCGYLSGITEPQNGWGGKGPPEIMLKQGHLEHVAQDHIPLGFGYLQRRLHILSGWSLLLHCSVRWYVQLPECRYLQWYRQSLWETKPVISVRNYLLPKAGGLVSL